MPLPTNNEKNLTTKVIRDKNYLAPAEWIVESEISYSRTTFVN